MKVNENERNEGREGWRMWTREYPVKTRNRKVWPEKFNRKRGWWDRERETGLRNRHISVLKKTWDPEGRVKESEEFVKSYLSARMLSYQVDVEKWVEESFKIEIEN